MLEFLENELLNLVSKVLIEILECATESNVWYVDNTFQSDAVPANGLSDYLQVRTYPTLNL